MSVSKDTDTIQVLVSVFGRRSGPAIRDRTETLPTGCTVQELLDLLSMRDEMPVKFGSGEGYSEFFVVVNGVNAMVGDGLSQPMPDGSRVLVLPAMAGG